jgi:DNA-binding IscR family transcriptional regulator
MDTRVRLTLAAHLLKHLARAQSRGVQLDLDQLATHLPESRGRIRQALSRLHEEGLVDVASMRLTLPGFALGRALAARKLHPLDKRVAGRAQQTTMAA